MDVISRANSGLIRMTNITLPAWIAIRTIRSALRSSSNSCVWFSLIPHKANEKDKPNFFARTPYKARARIEQGIGRIKCFKRVALRCEKTAGNFRSIVNFAAELCLIKFVQTA